MDSLDQTYSYQSFDAVKTDPVGTNQLKPKRILINICNDYIATFESFVLPFTPPAVRGNNSESL